MSPFPLHSFYPMPCNMGAGVKLCGAGMKRGTGSQPTTGYMSSHMAVMLDVYGESFR